MKRMLVAAAVTLALTAATRQQASAWCRFNFSTGLNVSYESSGNSFSFLGFSKTSSPSPDCYQGYGGGGYADPSAYGAYPAPGAPGAPAAPAPTPAAPAPGVQRTAHYGYPNYGQMNYGYTGQAAPTPGYWYGN